MARWLARGRRYTSRHSCVSATDAALSPCRGLSPWRGRLPIIRLIRMDTRIYREFSELNRKKKKQKLNLIKKCRKDLDIFPRKI